eukprot:1350440-Alexandrium_andersonii.AAC.1
MVCLQSLQDDIMGAAQAESRQGDLLHLLKMDPADDETKRKDTDLREDLEKDSEAAWRALAEGRLRWEAHGAITAR